MGDLGGTGDVTFVIFFLSSHIEDDVAFLAVHDFLGFLCVNANIYLSHFPGK